jgi:dihydrofolate reductase
MAGHPGEKITEGLDGLRGRLAEYRQMGARFAKWRAVIAVGDGIPSRGCIQANAHALARYAALCQEAGLVPVVEPEVLMDGAHINELEQPARTYLYGRRMYEAMLYWETAHTTVQPRLFQEFTGIWQAAENIVFSKTLASVSSARTRVEPAFEPGLVRQLKSAAEHDMRVGGADLAGQAIKAGLADEVRLFLVPVVVGGGKRALPDGVRSDLELLDTQRFASGAVYLRYCLQSA